MRSAVMVAVVVVLLAAAAVFLFRAHAPNRTIVHNASGTALENIRIEVEARDGSRQLVEKTDRLEDGDSFVLHHDMNDSRVTLTCSFGATHLEYTENYVDLWTGEGWVLEVRPDGTVQSGYEKPRAATPAD